MDYKTFWFQEKGNKNIPTPRPPRSAKTISHEFCPKFGSQERHERDDERNAKDANNDSEANQLERSYGGR